MNVQVTSKRTETVNAKFLELELPVRYEEEDMPNDAPGRKGDIFYAIIDVDDGLILNWPKGCSLKFYMKVTDAGCYRVLNADKEGIVAVDHDYVPAWVPGEYGDYVELSIDQNGKVENWDANKFASRFQQWLDERFND